MAPVVILTGTCGSGKTTVSTLLAETYGWRRISEDDIWKLQCGKNRGTFGSEEHRLKRMRVHDVVFADVLAAYRGDQRVVIDATVHEAPPAAYLEYKAFFEAHAIPWCVRVLHPRLEVAIARDSQRAGWVAGPERVRQLRAKFSGKVFSAECFIDNSDDIPEQTMLSVLAIGG